MESCYLCGHVFRVFEPHYVVKRLMDQGGVENRFYGVRYGKCMDCPRGLCREVPDWDKDMGEGKKRGPWLPPWMYEEIVWF